MAVQLQARQGAWSSVSSEIIIIGFVMQRDPDGCFPFPDRTGTAWKGSAGKPLTKYKYWRDRTVKDWYENDDGPGTGNRIISEFVPGQAVRESCGLGYKIFKNCVIHLRHRRVMSFAGRFSKPKPKSEYPRILLDPVYGAHKFAKLPGVTLHYVENGDRHKELLVFVHGFPEFWFSWRNQILEFSKDYWTVAVDMRGFGDSEKKKGRKHYKMEVLVDDVKNLIYFLGRTKCTLVAHDWGGSVGHYFIRSYPHMLNGYILLNTVFSVKLNEMIFKNREQFYKSWYIFMMMLPLIPEWLLRANNFKAFDKIFGKFSNSEEINAYKYMFKNFDQRNGPVNYYRANFKLRRKLGRDPGVDALNSCNVPGLYIHGSEDFAITKEVAVTASFEGVKNIKYANIPNADHFVQIQSAGLVNEIMRDFLNGRNIVQNDFVSQT